MPHDTHRFFRRHDPESAAQLKVRLVHAARLHEQFFALEILGDLVWISLTIRDRLLHRLDWQVKLGSDLLPPLKLNWLTPTSVCPSLPSGRPVHWNCYR
jgi:hypothetical protein